MEISTLELGSVWGAEKSFTLETDSIIPITVAEVASLTMTAGHLVHGRKPTASLPNHHQLPAVS